MAITRPDAPTIHADTVNAADATIEVSHEVTSGTTLLLVATGTRQTHQVSGITYNGDAMTLIGDFASGTQSTALMYSSVYGLVNPDVGTADIVVTYDDAPVGFNFVIGVNYKGTATASVDAATNLLSQDDNNTATNTSVHASAGNAGNALFFAGVAQGADMGPCSNDASFTELADLESGGGAANNGDGWFYVAETLSAAGATAITVTWAGTDENVSSYVEIVAAVASAPIKQAYHHYQHNLR